MSTDDNITDDKIESPLEKFADPMLRVGSSDNEPIAEEYRKLKSVIVQTARKKGFPYTFMVASSIGNEGKSITAINLALNLAKEHENSVVLIDADLRKPSLGKYLGLKSDVGLGDCLRGTAELKDALIPVIGANLLLLPAGARISNPVELISAQRMKDLMEQLRAEYPDSFIIIDTSPLLLFAEGRILSAMVDGVLFVLMAGGASKQLIAEALESIKEAEVLGLVCNKATEVILHRGYGYYNYYYYNYYDNYHRKESGKGSRTKPGIFSKIFRP